MFPKMLPGSLIYGSSALKISLQSDVKWNLQNGTKIVSLKHCCRHQMQLENASASAWRPVRQNDQSYNFENIFREQFFCHEYRVKFLFLFIFIFCIQTGSVENGWKFLVAKWTELALYRFSLVVHFEKEACFSLILTHRAIFKICTHFSGNTIFEKIVKILFPPKFQLFECFSSIWCSMLFTCTQWTGWKFG